MDRVIERRKERRVNRSGYGSLDKERVKRENIERRRKN